MLLHDFAKKARQGGRNRHKQPYQRGEHDAGDGDGLKRNRHGMGLAHMNVYLADMGDKFKPVNNDSGE